MNGIEQINSLIAAANTNKSSQGAQSPETLQKAAKQFEAILLMQLTSALNGTTNENDEDSLFGSDGGSSLAKQLFSEQMATTMSESGGVGIADMIMRQFGFNAANLSVKNMGNLGKMNPAVSSAVKEIRQNNSSSSPLPSSSFTEPVTGGKPVINRSGRVTPMRNEAIFGDTSEAAVVSTFDDQLKEQANDTTISPLFLEKRPYAETRARRVNAITNPATEAGEAGEAAPISSVSTIAGISGPSNVPSEPLNFNFPVRGRISSSFGGRLHPIDKVKKFHAGLDIAVPKGTPVDAAAEGTVVFAGPRGGYGNLVVIQHPDGKETRYGHLEKVLVSEGEKVSSRQQIALSGSTGKSTGPHLHFEMRENGQILNPLKFLSNVLPKSADR